MDYLALCQRTAQESGTVSGTGLPAAVTAQTQIRLIKIISWVALAWSDLQNLHAQWRWMEAQGSGNTTSGSAKYTPSSWSIDARFAEWITLESEVTMYLTATGVADENELTFISWREWKQKYDRGSQTNNRPIEFSISPANEFCLGPTPDDTYTVRFPYRKAAQILAANTDTPEMPARFHDMIWRNALTLLHAHDETLFPVVNFEGLYLQQLEELERDQLPQVEHSCEPLA